MKRHLFLLGSFMATSLIAANTLSVVGCKKKPSTVKENKEDEEDSKTVLLKKMAKLKNEIQNIIDDVITNPVSDANEESWIIELDNRFSQKNDIISSLKQQVEQMQKETKTEVEFTLPEAINDDLINVIQKKYADLKNIIIDRINNMKDELGIPNFEFNIKSDSIKLFLTALSGAQFLDAVKKLTNKPTLYSLDTKYAADEGINAITAIDLFKVKTNLSYSFTVGDTTDSGEYDEAELLLTGDINDYKKLNKFTVQTIQTVLTNAKELKEITIYGANANDGEDVTKEIQEYDYIGKQMDWDFSNQPVKDEVARIQFDKLEKMKGSKSGSELETLVKSMKYKIDGFEFESSNYMKFTNDGIDLRNGYGGCVLLCGHSVKTGSEVRDKLKTQFGLDVDVKPEESETFDNLISGQINAKFIEQAKKDGEQIDGKDPIIELKDYYGLGSADVSNNILIGYGKTTIRKASYAGMSLPKIVINTNLVSSYISMVESLFNSFLDYVEVLVDAVTNQNATQGAGKGVKYITEDKWDYFLKWNFGNEGEWSIIEEEINKSGNVTFDWIMENVLLNKRIKDNPGLYKLPDKDETVLSTARTSLKSANKVTYAPLENSAGNLIAKGQMKVRLYVYIKYGPFIGYLTSPESIPIWTGNNEPGISSTWPE